MLFRKGDGLLVQLWSLLCITVRYSYPDERDDSLIWRHVVLMVQNYGPNFCNGHGFLQGAQRTGRDRLVIRLEEAMPYMTYHELNTMADVTADMELKNRYKDAQLHAWQPTLMSCNPTADFSETTLLSMVDGVTTR